MTKDKFSSRYGFEPKDADIQIRHEAPVELRAIVADIAYEAGLSPHSLRGIMCKILRVREDPSNWSAFPNVDGEARAHLESCEWYEIYDVVEAIYSSLKSKDERRDWDEKRAGSEYFTEELNKYFRKRGIGWQLIDGAIGIRGPESFESIVAGAREALRDTGRDTAENENS